jgi:hypothetical protein
VGGGTSSLNLQIRKELDLFAHVCHAYDFPGIKARCAPLAQPLLDGCARGGAPIDRCWGMGHRWRQLVRGPHNLGARCCGPAPAPS